MQPCVLQGSTHSMRRLSHVLAGVDTALSARWISDFTPASIVAFGEVLRSTASHLWRLVHTGHHRQGEGRSQPDEGRSQGRSRRSQGQGEDHTISSTDPGSGCATPVSPRVCAAHGAAEALHTATLPAAYTCSLDASLLCHLHTVAPL